MYGLVHVATVTLPNDTDGDYTVVDNAALPCRLTLVSPTDGTDARDRVELASMRRLLWNYDYVMSEQARVTIDGINWNVEPGTLAFVTGVGGRPVYRRAELTRAL